MMTEKEIKILDKYLRQVVQNNYKCQHCFCRDDQDFCFWAYECVKNDFNLYAEPTG